MEAAVKTIKRDLRVDILRAIAIVCIVIAHSNPPDLVIELRNFDVTLMVFLLGISFSMSTRSKKPAYLDYVKKRFKRLVTPTWIFLTVFFCLFYLIAKIRGDAFYFNWRVILGSYTLIDGIGFVWIMRVFFLIALICPFILTMSEKIKRNDLYFGVLALGYLLYKGLLLIDLQLHGGIEKTYSSFIVYGFGYGLIAALGIRFKNLTNKQSLALGLVMLIAYMSCMYRYNFASTESYKYPPTLYYLSYGLFASILLYKLLEIKSIEAVFDNRFVAFLSRSSVWLYFWHIIFIYVIKLFGSSMPGISGNAISRFVFIFSCALIITILQEMIEEFFKNNKLPGRTNSETVNSTRL